MIGLEVTGMKIAGVVVFDSKANVIMIYVQGLVHRMIDLILYYLIQLRCSCDSFDDVTSSLKVSSQHSCALRQN